MSKIYELARQYHPWAVEIRQYLHKHPELSGHETATQQKLANILNELGLKCRPMATTGLIADMPGGKPGKTIAIRADIDALPLDDECGKPYQSVNQGICHACGHDGHTAILLGAIRVLLEMRQELAGTYRFIFQPSEEQFPCGAEAMIAAGALDGVDAIIGAHIWQPLALGTVGISYGNVMAAPDKFTITIHGRGGHGSMPHQTADPILAAAQLIMTANTIVSRNVNPLDPAVVSLGSIHAGHAFNIIPDSAVIEGTVRSFDEAVRQQVYQRLLTIADGIGQTYQVSCSVDMLFGFPAVVNNCDCAKEFAASAAQCHNPITGNKVSPVMCAEDFAYYLQKIPGAFVLLGTGTDEIVYPHHHPKFDIDERVILYGIELMARTAVNMAAAD